MSLVKWKDGENGSYAKIGSLYFVIEGSLRRPNDYAWGIEGMISNESSWNGHYKTMRIAQVAAERWAREECRRMLKTLEA